MRSCLTFAMATLWGCSTMPTPQAPENALIAQPPYGALASCGRDGDDSAEAAISSGQPLAILVHGCNASQGRFQQLAEVFMLHGQQALCYRYDDRRRIPDVGAELARTIAALSPRLSSEVTLLGHSLGGLVARAAATQIGAAPLGAAPRIKTGEWMRLSLVTVSSPFNGVRAAKDCGATWLHMLSFGATLAVCRAVAGAKWRDIHPRAALVRSPAPLSPSVRSHLEIRTDERASCRQLADDGNCARSDFVFSLREQENPRLSRDARVTTDIVRSGHVAIVGTDNLVPYELLSRLQQHHVLRPTPSDRRVALHALLQRLF